MHPGLTLPPHFRAPWQRIAEIAKALTPLAMRLAWRIPMMLVVSMIVFIVLRVVPADPLGMLVPPNASPADVAEIRHALGLDLSIPAQYGIWLRNALHGDLGVSIQSGRPVAALIANALPTTLQLVASGLVMGILVGIGSALIAFRYRNTAIERGADIANSIAISIPEFLWAILLILGVGIGLRWLPFLGPIDSGMTVARVTGFLLIDSLLAGDFAAFGSTIEHLVMPSIALCLGIAPPLMRILRSSLMEAYNEEYVVAARLRGLSESTILLRHALKNAALPTITLIGMQAGTVIGGTLLIETIFGFPGIGTLMVSAIGNHDLPVIQALALTYALAVQIMSMITDAILLYLNPRLRVSR